MNFYQAVISLLRSEYEDYATRLTNLKELASERLEDREAEIIVEDLLGLSGNIYNPPVEYRAGFKNKIQDLKVILKTPKPEKAQSLLIAIFKNIEMFMGFYPSNYHEWPKTETDLLDSLVDRVLNVKDPSELIHLQEHLSNAPTPTDTESYYQNLIARVDQFIALKKEPTSSYYELDDSLAESIVRTLTELASKFMPKTEIEIVLPPPDLNRNLDVVEIVDYLVSLKKSYTYRQDLESIAWSLKAIKVNNRVYQTLINLVLTGNTEYSTVINDLMKVYNE